MSRRHAREAALLTLFEREFDQIVRRLSRQGILPATLWTG